MPAFGPLRTSPAAFICLQSLSFTRSHPRDKRLWPGQRVAINRKGIKMRRLLRVSLMIVATTCPCFALSPQANSFIKSIGINPGDPDVVAAETEGVIKTDYHGDPASYSLENLASARKANAVRSFVFTRKLIRQLKANFDTYHLAVPSPGYDSRYLTKSERALVGRKIADQYAKQLKK